MVKLFFAVLALVIVADTRVARAHEEHQAHWLLAVGAMDARMFQSGEPTIHLGPYATVDVKYVRHISESWMIIPALGFDWAPVGNQWGFSGSFSFEGKIHERFRFDFSFVLMHDQNGHAEFFAGAGPGFAVKLSNHWLIEALFPFLARVSVHRGMLFAPSCSLAYRF